MSSKTDDEIKFRKIAVSSTKTWTLATFKVCLAVLHVTFVMIMVVITDAIVLDVVSLAFGNTTSQPILAQYIFYSLKVLSILGTTLLYIIYLAYSLTGEAMRVFRLLKEEKG